MTNDIMNKWNETVAESRRYRAIINNPLPATPTLDAVESIRQALTIIEGALDTLKINNQMDLTLAELTNLTRISLETK